MKAAAIERNVLEVVSSNKKPMSVHDIALKVKTMRHKINPVINALAKEGKLEIIEGGEIPLFVYRQGLSAEEGRPEPQKSASPAKVATKASGPKAKPKDQDTLSVKRAKPETSQSDKVSPISRGKDIEADAYQLIKDSEVPVTIEQIAEQLGSPAHWIRRSVAKMVKENTITGENKVGFSCVDVFPDLEEPEKPTTQAIKGTEPGKASQLSASNIDERVQPEAIEMRILSALANKPSQLTDLFDELGDIQPVLDKLKADKMIDASVIWRGELPIYDILDAGRGYLDKHQAALDQEISSKGTQKLEQAIAEVTEAHAVAPEAARTEGVRPYDRVSSEAESTETESRVLLEISEMVAKLVDERIAKIDEEKKKRGIGLKTDIQESIMEVTSSLKTAIDSLNKLSSQLNQTL